GVVGPKTAGKSGRKLPHESVFHRFTAKRPADNVPGRVLLGREMPDIFGKEIDFHPRMGAVWKHIALVAPGERPIVGRDRHGREHARIEVVGKYPIELEVIEWRRSLAGRINRADDVVAHALDRAAALRVVYCNGLVHGSPVGMRCGTLPARTR